MRWFEGHAIACASAFGDARASAPWPLCRRIIDPNRPESVSLLMLAPACSPCRAWFALLAVMGTRGGPLLLDHSVRDAMASYAIRLPIG